MFSHPVRAFIPCLVFLLAAWVPVDAYGVTATVNVSCNATGGTGDSARDSQFPALVTCADTGLTAVGTTQILTSARATGSVFGGGGFTVLDVRVTGGGRGVAGATAVSSAFIFQVAAMPTPVTSIPLLIDVPDFVFNPSATGSISGEIIVGFLQLFADGSPSGNRLDAILDFDPQNPLPPSALTIPFEWFVSSPAGIEATVGLSLFCDAFAAPGSGAGCDLNASLPVPRFDQAAFDARMGANTFQLDSVFQIIVPEPAIGMLMATMMVAVIVGRRNSASSRE